MEIDIDVLQEMWDERPDKRRGIWGDWLGHVAEGEDEMTEQDPETSDERLAAAVQRLEETAAAYDTKFAEVCDNINAAFKRYDELIDKFGGPAIMEAFLDGVRDKPMGDPGPPQDERRGY